MNSEPPKRIDINPENFSYYDKLAETNLKMGQPEQAIYLYRECLFF